MTEVSRGPRMLYVSPPSNPAAHQHNLQQLREAFPGWILDARRVRDVVAALEDRPDVCFLDCSQMSLTKLAVCLKTIRRIRSCLLAAGIVVWPAPDLLTSITEGVSPSTRVLDPTNAHDFDYLRREVSMSQLRVLS